MLTWWPQLVSSLIAAGHLERAANELGRFTAAAAEAGLPVDAHLADLGGRLALARDDADGAVASFEVAFEALTPDHPMLERLLLMREFGRVLRLGGHRRRSEDMLRAAHTQLDRLGAAPYRDRLEEDLREGGTATRPKRARQPFALTPRETDVAVLVKQGMSNKEVASALYISTKAVEYHLSKVYGKLSITSRRELRAIDL
jgi:DNA-binding CsgD family transcriptional regulator